MAVHFFSEDCDFNLKRRLKIKQWIKETIVNEQKKLGEINYIFTSDKNILSINNEYLSHNYFTDIITFNYCENDVINSDIYISVDTVENNSQRFNVSFLDELYRVIIHGILHLIGYDDQNEEQKKIMREKENYYLDRFKNLS